MHFWIQSLLAAVISVHGIPFPSSTKAGKMFTVPNYERHYRFPFTHTIKKYSRSRMGCAKECVADESCEAINIKQDGDIYVCEISSESASSYKNLETDMNSRYYEKERTCFNGGQWDFAAENCSNCQHLTFGKYCDQYLVDCNDAWLTFPKKQNTGTYNILIKPADAVVPFMVVCRMAFGGIIYSAKRMISANPSENFYRSWEEYKNGFGDFAKEYFLGLEKLHLITQKTRRLKISVTLNGDTHGANYYGFKIDSEANSYKLHYNKYSVGEGSPGDGFNFGDAGGRIIDGLPFCTFDKDCDNCAKNSKSGWWFNINCANVNLHGLKNESGSFKWLINNLLQKVDQIVYLIF